MSMTKSKKTGFFSICPRYQTPSGNVIIRGSPSVLSVSSVAKVLRRLRHLRTADHGLRLRRNSGGVFQ